MADKKYLDEDGLAVVATKVNEKLKVVTTMPATPTNGQVVLYVGATTATYTQGGIYLYNGTAWVLISTADVDLTPYKKIFTGTRAEWELLTTAEKKAYDEADLTDDLAGGELVVTDAVTAGDLNPVTSNAVANALGDKFIFEQETTADIAMSSMVYGCIDTNLAITKVGYTLVSACAYVEFSDAILCSVYPYAGGKFRITYLNTATSTQTVPVVVRLLWMKD